MRSPFAVPDDPLVVANARGRGWPLAIMKDPPGPATARFQVCVLLTTVISSLLVFHNTGRKSLWFDEGVTVGLVSTSWGPMWAFVRDHETNMGLYTVLLKLWTTAGDDVTWSRAFSGIAVVATIPLLAATGRRLLGETTGIIAGLLIAVNAFAIHYGQEDRSYGLTLFLVTLTLYLVCRLLDTSRPGLSVMWGLACSAAIYSHVVATFTVACEIVAVTLLFRTKAACLSPGVVLQAIGCAPLFWVLHRQGSTRLSWVPPLRASRLTPTVAETVGAVGTSPLLWLYCACMALGVLLGWRSRPMWFTLVVGFGSLLANVIASVFLAPLFLPRYLIVTVPGLTLLAAFGMARLPRFVARGPILAVTVAFALISVRAYYGTPPPEDFRAAARLVVDRSDRSDRSDRKDAIAFFNPAGYAPFTFYARDHSDPLPRSLVPRVDGGRSLYDRPTPGGPAAEVRQAASELCGYRRIWLVSSHDRTAWVGAVQADFIRAVNADGFRLDSTETVPGVTVRSYLRRKTDHGCQ
ncbi:glycosyltransferase family 39 protein [Frankia sp. Cas3]|uniref:glycosyltransferase family 39 protein n=1 Tax=Frankia sp. Cas3 TaxID=3073926 RepID=UPI002AD38078|nr:glycosyltransferase family 39 protein [Frankia sp. Cas3]